VGYAFGINALLYEMTLIVAVANQRGGGSASSFSSPLPI
jgi:hypothetical protein